MMNSDLLKEIAKTVLSELIGPGGWFKTREYPTFTPAANPMTDLVVGDVVYTYNEESYEMLECNVVVVVDRIGYVMSVHHYYGPILKPVTNEYYARTIEGAAEIWQDVIDDDFCSAQQDYERLSKAKSLITLPALPVSSAASEATRPVRHSPDARE